MKNCILHFCFTFLICVSFSIYAQESTEFSGKKSENILNLNSFNDIATQHLSNTDTIPGFESKENKLKISGTIYKSDGVTPAKDVILYIEQADENGDFDLRKENDIRYVHNRGWIKTDSSGNYTFYTYIPGNDRRYNQMQQIFPIIKEPSKPEYEIGTFLFDEDPLLSKLCRKRMAKKGDITRILKLKKVDGIFVTQKDIILHDAVVMTN
jgi:protocatechuate 3,4-dioxygenase beta subunit